MALALITLNSVIFQYHMNWLRLGRALDWIELCIIYLIQPDLCYIFCKCSVLRRYYIKLWLTIASLVLLICILYLLLLINYLLKLILHLLLRYLLLMYINSFGWRSPLHILKHYIFFLYCLWESILIVLLHIYHHLVHWIFVLSFLVIILIASIIWMVILWIFLGSRLIHLFKSFNWLLSTYFWHFAWGYCIGSFDILIDFYRRNHLGHLSHINILISVNFNWSFMFK